MVKGLEKFREHFDGFTERYVLIGGTAATLAMEELGVDFRATKDLDLVLCVEALDAAFARKFWDFVRTGGYQNRQQSTGRKLFYRFYGPTNAGYPEMLELFSRVPDALDVPEGSKLTRIPVGDDVSSLSAILLDDAYYKLIHECKRVVGGLAIIGPECLIPLKAKAYTDLAGKRAAGGAIDARQVKKHKNDLFRLYAVLDLSRKPTLEDRVKSDLAQAFAMLRAGTVDLKALGVRAGSVDEVLSELEEFYDLGG